MRGKNMRKCKRIEFTRIPAGRAQIYQFLLLFIGITGCFIPSTQAQFTADMGQSRGKTLNELQEWVSPADRGTGIFQPYFQVFTSGHFIQSGRNDAYVWQPGSSQEKGLFLSRPPEHLKSDPSAKWTADELPFFCRIEHNLGKKTKVPFKFRLGSVEYVDWLEKKPGCTNFDH